MDAKIYKVITWGDAYDSTPRKNLGFCYGTEKNIRDYFEHKRCEELFLQEIPVMTVTAEMAAEKMRLFKKKNELSKDLDEIEKKLKS